MPRRLQTDRAGADHEQPLGHLGERQCLGGGDDALAVERKSGELDRGAACRDEDAPALERAGIGVRHLDLAGTGDPSRAVHVIDAVLLEQPYDPLGEHEDDAVLAAHHLGEIELHARHLDPVRTQAAAGL